MVDCICRILSSRAAVAQSLGVLTVAVAIGFLPVLSAQVPDPAVHYTCYDVDSCEDSCETDISQLNVMYTGANPNPVKFTVDSNDLDPGSDVEFTLLNGETIFNFLGTPLQGKNGGTGKIGNDVKFKLVGDQPPLGDDGDEFAKIHTSCSKPIFEGMAFGDQGNGYGPFTVAAGTTTVGGEPLLPCLEFVEQQFVTLNDQFNVHPFDLTERLRLCAPTIKTPLSFVPAGACLVDADCAFGQVCDAVGGGCVECIDDANCAAGQVCDGVGACAPGPACLDDIDCAPGQVCDSAGACNDFLSGPHLVSYKLEDALAAPSECGDCSGGLKAIEVIYTGDPDHDPITGPDCVDFELLDSDIVNPGPHKLCNPEVLDPLVIVGAPFFPSVVIAAIPGSRPFPATSCPV